MRSLAPPLVLLASAAAFAGPLLPVAVAQDVPDVAVSPESGRSQPSTTGETTPEVAAARAMAWLEARHGTADHPYTVGSAAAHALVLQTNGTTLRSGPRRDSLKRLVNFLRQRQLPDGSFGTEDPVTNSLGALAMMEAHVLSSYRLIERNARRGVAHTRQRFGAQENGPPLLHLGVIAPALFTGRSIDESDPQQDRALLEWVDSLRHDESGRYRMDRVAPWSGRRSREHLAAFPLEFGELATASALCARIFLTRDATDEERADLLKSAEVLRRRPPVWNEQIGSIDEMYWLLAATALHQVEGDVGAEWSRQLRKVLVEHQVDAGPEAGSWDPVGAWGSTEGRAWTTAILLLTLQAEDRYSRPSTAGNAKKKDSKYGFR